MGFKLKILGSNSALPTPERFSTAQLLNIDNNLFLIDCAEGTQIRLKEHKVSLLKINHILISHLHSDHFLGLFGVLSSLSLLGKTTEFHIYAHKKLEEMLDFYTDFVGKKLSFNYKFHALSDEFQLLYEDRNYSVTSFPVNHGKIPCCGFLFKTKESLKLDKQALEKYDISISWRKRIKEGEDFIDRNNKIIPIKDLTIKVPPKSYAYSGDTIFHKPMVEYIKDTDLLYHEATFSEKEKNLAEQYYHSTALEAATIAKLANAKKLILGHFSGRLKEMNVLLTEAKKVFSNTFVVNDGDEFTIE